MDYKKPPRITRKISLKKFMEGEYKTLFVEKPKLQPKRITPSVSYFTQKCSNLLRNTKVKMI